MNAVSRLNFRPTIFIDRYLGEFGRLFPMLYGQANIISETASSKEDGSMPSLTGSVSVIWRRCQEGDTSTRRQPWRL